jgi:hypothetical protein
VWITDLEWMMMVVLVIMGHECERGMVCGREISRIEEREKRTLKGEEY